MVVRGRWSGVRSPSIHRVTERASIPLGSRDMAFPSFVSQLLLGGGLLFIAAIVAIAAWLIAKRVKTRANDVQADAPLESSVPSLATFDEAPILDIERALERLIADGTLVVEVASTDDLARARIPEHAGPQFRALARRFRTIRLREVDVAFHLHDGSIADDALGGWRLRAEPAEIDVRLASAHGSIDNSSGDVIVDATWSPRATHEVAQHSTIVHFIVRAAVGDRV